MAFTKWDHRFMEMTDTISGWASCYQKNRKMGAVIVRDKRILTTGYNGAPQGIKPCVERGECLRRKLGIPSGTRAEVCYAVQDYSSLPAFYTVPAGRTKPFGTTHAVLCARPYVQEPFCVINADDYYGVDAYRAIYQELGRLPQQGKATMVGYLLRNTISAHGTVSRGVCHVEDGHLTGIHEALKIQLFPDGSIADVADGQRRELAADMPVSMNFWGFMPSIFDQMEEYLDDFLRALPPEEIKAECLLPNMVGDLLKKGRLSVSVLHSADRWFGMTYHQDRQAVARELARLHENGTYPPTLRS